MEADDKPVQSVPFSAVPAEENQHSTPAPSVTQSLPETLSDQNETTLIHPAHPIPTPVYADPLAQPPGQVYEHFGTSGEPLQPGPVTPFGVQAGTENAAAFYPQAAYGTFPGQPYIPPPATRKRRYGLRIALIIALILVLGGGSALAFALTQNPPPPDLTIQTYCHGIKTSNAQEIYGTLSQQARAKTSLSEIQQIFQALDQLNGLGISYSDCTFNNVRVSGSLAVATITLTMTMTLLGANTSVPSTSLISLVLENNQWKIDFSNLTQPLPNFMSGSV